MFNPYLQIADHPGEQTTRLPKLVDPTEDRTLEKNRESLFKARTGAKDKAVQMIVKPLVSRAQDLLSQHELLLPLGKSAKVFCNDLAIAVEMAVFTNCYEAAKVPAEYNNKIRSIHFNLGKNHSLASEVLSGGIPPKRLAQMNTDEMANKELKEYMEKVRIQAEINVTLVTTDGPRIRKTHKGEELVEPLHQPSRSPGPEEIFSPSFIESDPPDQPEDVQHNEQAGGIQNLQNADAIEVASPPDSWTLIPTHSCSRPKSPNQGKQLYTLSGFDQVGVDKDIQFYEEFEGSNNFQPCMPHDIDSDSQPWASQSPPSTLDSASGECVVGTSSGEQWVGRIEMRGIEGICTRGELVGGPNTISGAKWSDLLDELLHVDSDVSPAVANSYLKDLCTSNSTSVMMANLRPMDVADKTEWTRVFNHFIHIGRYGVVGKHYLGCIRAMYLICLENHHQAPGWFEHLGPPAVIDTYCQDPRLMLVVFAIIRNQVDTTPLGIDEQPKLDFWGDDVRRRATCESVRTLSITGSSANTANYITHGDGVRESYSGTSNSYRSRSSDSEGLDD